jgi:hypothetical protein
MRIAVDPPLRSVPEYLEPEPVWLMAGKDMGKICRRGDSCPIANAFPRKGKRKKPAPPESWVRTGIGTMLA